MTELVKTKQNLDKLAKAEVRLNEYCQRVSNNLDNLTFSEKRLALDALEVKVIADRDNIEIQGVVHVDLSGTVSATKQSSRYLL
ncbi:hypothetical protein ACFLS8_03330 [Chloroflexota bacterium]